MRRPGTRAVVPPITFTLVVALLFGSLLIVSTPTAQAATLTAVSVSGATQSTGVTETYTVQFTTVTAIGNAGDVRLVFPTGYVLSVASVCAISGLTIVTTVVGQEVVCQFGALDGIASATAVTVTITNVRNPTTAQTTGTFTIQTRAPITDTVLDNHLTNTETITASTLGAPSISAPLQTTGAVETWTVEFTTVNAVAASGDIRIVFPAGFTLSSGAASSCDVTAPLTVLGETTSVSGSDVVCQLGVADSIAASTVLTLTISNVQNPSTVQTTAAFTLQTRDNTDAVHDQHTTDTESITANTPGSVAFSAPNQRAGETETWTLAFTPVNALADGADIRIVLPTGFQTSSGAASVCAITGKTLTTSVASATEIVCSLSTSTIAAAESVALTITNLRNPTTAQTTAAFALQLRDPTDTVQEAHTTNTETIVANELTGVAISAPLQTAGTVETWTIAFTTTNAVDDAGDIRIVFPAGFQTSSGAATTCAITGKTLSASILSATEVVCTLSGSSLTQAESVSLSLTNIRNPTSSQTTGAFTLQTRDSADAVHDQHTANTETINPSPLVGLTISAPTQRTSATETWTIAFTTTNAIAAGGDIRIVFPSAFTPNLATTACDISGITGEATTVIGDTVTCELVLNSLTAGQAVSISVTNVQNPTTVQTTSAFTVQTRTSLDVVVDEDTADTESITASLLTSVTASAPTQLTGAVETWTIQFTTVSAVAASGDIRIVFPSGYTLSSGGTSACDVTAPLTVVGESSSVSGSTITCTLGALDSIAAGGTVTLSVSLVQNPSTVQTTAAFSIQTRDAADDVHDQHLTETAAISANTPSAFSISASTQKAGAVETWSFAMTPVNALADGADVRIILPSGFQTSSGAATLCAATGKTLTTTVASATEVVCSLSGSSIAAAEAFTLTLTNIKNPTTEQTTGTYSIQLRDPTDAMQEQHLTDTESIGANLLAAVSIGAPLQEAAAVETWTFDFTTFNAVASGGSIHLIFPAGFTLSSGAASVCAATGKTLATTVASATEIDCELSGSTLAEAESVSLTITNVENPSTAQTTAAFSLQTLSSSDATHDEDVTQTADIEGAALSSVSVDAAARQTSRVETWTIGFTTTNAVAAGGDIRIVFPAGFAADAVNTACDVAGMTGETTVALGAEVVCELGPLNSIAASQAITLTVSDMQNPSTEGTTATFTIQTRSLLNTVIDQSTSQTASIVATPLGSVGLSAPLQQTLSIEAWTLEFTTVHGLGAGGDVRIELPAGFQTDAGAATTCDVAGTALESTTVVNAREVVCELNAYTLSASDAVSIAFSNIQNPDTAQTTAAPTIELRDAADGVTESDAAQALVIVASPLTSLSASGTTNRAGQAATWTLGFTVDNAVAAGGDIRIVLPSGFVTSTGGTSVCDVTGLSAEDTVIVSTSEIVCELDTETLTAGQAVELTLSWVRNPAAAGVTAAFTIQTRDASNNVHDAASTLTVTILAAGGGGGGAPEPEPEPAVSGSTWTIDYVPAASFGLGAELRITFPEGFRTSSGAASVCSVAGRTDVTTLVLGERDIACLLGVHGLVQGVAIRLSVSNLLYPATTPTTNATIRVLLNGIETGAPTEIGRLSLIGHAFASISTVDVANRTAGATSHYRVEIKTFTAVPAGGRIEVRFPAGFGIGAADLTIRVGTTVLSGSLVRQGDGFFFTPASTAGIASATVIIVNVTRVTNPNQTVADGIRIITLHPSGLPLDEGTTSGFQFVLASSRLDPDAPSPTSQPTPVASGKVPIKVRLAPGPQVAWFLALLALAAMVRSRRAD